MTNQYFPHEKIDAYPKALEFVRMTSPWIDRWPSNVSVCDQLDRASESIIINLAKAVQEHGTDKGIYYLECSLGSALECAACLDVGRTKRLLAEPDVLAGKQLLQSIVQIEVGLRRSWGSAVREGDTEKYGRTPRRFFSHETLHVYQRALQLFEELENRLLADGSGIPRHLRRIDGFATSLVLNIAEGNGRFSHLDHSKFVDVAEDAGIKLAAYLDLTEVAGTDMRPARSLLREVMAMLSGLKGYLNDQTEG